MVNETLPALSNITLRGTSSWTFKKTNWTWLPSRPSLTMPRPVALLLTGSGGSVVAVLIASWRPGRRPAR